MKKIISVVLFVTMLCFGLNAVTRSGSGSNPPPPPQHHDNHEPHHDRHFDLTINCRENNALVFIDGEKVGEVNQTYKVRDGQHDIKVVKPGFEDFNMKIESDKDRTVNVDLKRLPPPPPRHDDRHEPHHDNHGPHHDRHFDLTINCRENNALVFIDGEKVGEGNQTYKVRDGQHDIKVVKPGFEDFNMKIESDKDRTVNVDLKRLPPPKHDDRHDPHHDNHGPHHGK